MLKLAVVGMGIGGSHGAVIHKSGVAELTAVCDADTRKKDARLKAYADEIDAHPKWYDDFENMLQTEELDGVVIATPSGTHHILAGIAAKHHTHMMIEKPLDISIENMNAIERAVSDAGVKCGVNFQQRFLPRNWTIKQAIDRGDFGKLLMVDFRMKWYRDQDYYDRGGWRGTWKMDGGGSMMNQGVHSIDLLTWFAGARPVSVTGAYAVLNHDIETEDWAAGIVTFENGVKSIVLTTTCVFPKTDNTFFDIHGTKGTAYLSKDGVIETNIDALASPIDAPYPNALMDFIHAIIDDREPYVNIEQARRSVELIQAVYTSCREKRVIEL